MTFFLFPFLFAIAGLLHAAVIAQVWLWFVVPQFGLAPLPLATAFGLFQLWQLFRGFQDYTRTERPDVTPAGKIWIAFGFSVVYALFGLGLAYIAHLVGAGF